jgi:hypothetical protein
VVVYLVAATLYIKAGVWLHEQLHCLAFLGNVHKRLTYITYKWKYILALSGYYWARGANNYRNMRRALLAPLLLSIRLMVVGWLGSLALPDWWLPILLSLIVVSLLDMVHDLYMYSQIRVIGRRGKYWDRGRELEIIWKEWDLGREIFHAPSNDPIAAPSEALRDSPDR